MIKETDKKEKELLDLISDLEFKIKKLKDHKRYGLVWENKIEKFDKESKDALPVLSEKGNKYPDIIADKNEDFKKLIKKIFTSRHLHHRWWILLHLHLRLHS